MKRWVDLKCREMCNDVRVFTLFFPRIVDDSQILTIPTNAQLYYYVFHSYLTTTFNFFPPEVL